MLDAGDAVAAERVVADAAREAKERHGPESHEYALAANDWGTVLVKMRQYGRAVDAFRDACVGPWPRGEALRDRLNFLMNYGQALAYSGRVDEAEPVLQQALSGREGFYGPGHPGYAVGLEPMAELMLRRSRPEAAVAMIDEAVAVFRRVGHPRLVPAMALRAEAVKAAGSDAPPFEGAEQLSDAQVDELARFVFGRLGQAPAETLRRVVSGLVSILSARLGEDHQTTLNALTLLANLEKELGEGGDFAVRQDAIRRTLAAYDRRGEHRRAAQAVLALAAAQREATQHDAALATYRDALDRAERLGDLVLRSQALRRQGELLAVMDRLDEAEEALWLSVAVAEQADGAAEAVGRAQAALGGFFRKAGRPAEALPLLRDALEKLPDAHPDAARAREHLKAAEDGTSAAPAGEDDESMADAFRQFVMSRVPPDLLARLDIARVGHEFKVGVHVKRKPADEEVQLLNRVIHEAAAQFRRLQPPKPA